MTGVFEKTDVMVRVNKKISEDVRKNYSLSKILDSAMVEYVSDENQDLITAMRRSQINLMIAEAEGDLKVVVQKKATLEVYIGYLKTKLQDIEEDVKRSKEVNLLYKYYNVYRRLCISAKFDFATVKEKGGETIAMIKLIDPTFNAESYMRRYKALLEE